jgi:hypothetical protein
VRHPKSSGDYIPSLAEVNADARRGAVWLSLKLSGTHSELTSSINMSEEIKQQIPASNLEIYGMIYVIEVAVRELIIEKLSALHGAKWHTEAIPGGTGGQRDGKEVLSMLEKYKRGERSAKSTPWSENVLHHPIYYLDFPELAIIFERKNNWSAFQDIFVRKEIAINTLRELEPIRNKIAHNRKASRADLNIVTGAYEKLSAAIGKSKMAELAGRCTNAEELPAQLLALSREADQAHERCVRCQPVESLASWNATSKQWWFETEYLGRDVRPIENYFNTLEGYAQLPRTRGTGHVIEKWLKREMLEAKYAEAKEAFIALLEDFTDD